MATAIVNDYAETLEAYQSDAFEIISFEAAKARYRKRHNSGDNALYWHVKPFPTQLRFLRSAQPFPLFIGGYNCGKTWVGEHKGISMAFINPGLPGIITAPTYQMLDDAMIPEAMNQLSEAGIPFRFNKSNHNLSLPWIGSTIHYRSAQYPDRLKSLNAAWALADEIAMLDVELWNVLIGRVRHKDAKLLQCCGVGTPEGLNWVYEKWEESPQPGYELFRAASHENTLVSDQYIHHLESNLPQEEIQQKVYGEFSDTARGHVYAAYFSMADSVTEQCPFIAANENGQLYSKHLPLSLACDFNVAWARWLVGQERDGVFWVFDELALDNVYTDTMCEEFNRRYGNHPAGVIVYGDASGRARSTSGASGTDYDIMARAGLRDQRVPKANPPVKDRVLAVNGKLKNAKGERKLFVHPQCKELIKDFKRVKWTQGSTTQLDKGSDPARTHASDALGYWIAEKTPLHSWTPQSGQSHWL